MKRIAMFSYHTCPLASEEGKESGGMNVYVLELSRRLAASGHEVDIFTRSVDSKNTPVVPVTPGLRVIHIPAGPQQMISKKQIAGYIPDFVREVQAFCQKEHCTYDLFHCHYYLSGLIGVELKTLYPNVPLVMSFHTLALMKNLVARSDEEKEDVFRIRKETELVAAADAIIATSEYDSEYLRYLYAAEPGKLVTIPPGVDTDLFRPMDMNTSKTKAAIPCDHKMILFSGRIEPLKGIDVLLYAMKIVSHRNPEIPVCLCIVGGDISQDPSLWSYTLRTLDDIRNILHLSTSVKFLGQQPQKMLPYFYNSAEMVVMPSHYESFGMTALEAMACGVPVITTNVAGISSLIDKKHANLVTTVNNPLLLASQIESLLLHPEKRFAIGESLRYHVMDLTWDRVAKKIDSVYDRVMTGGLS
jgi:D-inositol-3-phosphate glycosyltransferase